MKQAKRKKLLTLLLTILLIVAYILILAAYNATVIRLRRPKDGAPEAAAIDSAVEEVGIVWKET